MSGGSSAELGAIGHASIGTDEKTASKCAAWSQRKSRVEIGQRLSSRTTLIRRIRNDISHRRLRNDSGYKSDPTRPQSTKFDVEEPVANRAVDIPRSSCQDGAAKASTQVGHIKVGSELFLTEVRIFIGK